MAMIKTIRGNWESLYVGSYAGLYGTFRECQAVTEGAFIIYIPLDQTPNVWQERDRPIIFIAHSLGGILIKQVGLWNVSIDPLCTTTYHYLLFSSTIGINDSKVQFS